MKNLIKISMFVFSIFVIQTTLVFATDYNYLPNDVFIKQQEEKSALEYRLQKLESGISSNSSSFVSNISSRISQLESERATEKNYISGTYARLGIANQLQAKLDEIDRKYDAQISSLRNQQSNLENTISSQQSNATEISNLKLQIAQLKAQMVDQELQTNLKALEKYQIKTEEYSDADIETVFNYIDAMSLEDASNFYQVVKKNNPDVAERVAVLYFKKYPNGKVGTANNDEYTKSTKETNKIEKTIIKQETKKIETKSLSLEEKPISQIQIEQPKIQTEQIQEQKPVQTKTTFRQKVSGFFKRIFGIK
jgi:hypothetical protein